MNTFEHQNRGRKGMQCVVLGILTTGIITPFLGFPIS